MNIVVLLKQVPATESLIRITDDGKTIRRDDLKWVMNPYDEMAVEEALQVRQAHGGQVTVLSLGPEKCVEALRTALAMGADKALRVEATDAAHDPLATAKILKAALGEIPFDLILAGHRAVDSDDYQVGSAVAELLDIPVINMVIEQEIEAGQIRCTRTIDGGTEVIQAPLPALITTQRGLNEPRYASLPGIMKAKKKPIETRTIEELGLSAEALAPQVWIERMALPPERSAGRIIQGDSAQAKVDELVKLLHETEKVI